jgi:hypothetical protein
MTKPKTSGKRPDLRGTWDERQVGCGGPIAMGWLSAGRIFCCKSHGGGIPFAFYPIGAKCGDRLAPAPRSGKKGK